MDIGEWIISENLQFKHSWIFEEMDRTFSSFKAIKYILLSKVTQWKQMAEIIKYLIWKGYHDDSKLS